MLRVTMFLVLSLVTACSEPAQSPTVEPGPAPTGAPQAAPAPNPEQPAPAPTSEAAPDGAIDEIVFRFHERTVPPDTQGKGGWLSSYAPGAIHGGGVEVSYVGRVKASDDELANGTFIIAVKMDNGVNSHGPRGAVIVHDDGTITFLGSSAHKPIDAGGNAAMNCTDYPFDSRYRFNADLSTLICADCSNCTSQLPCPG